MLSTTHQDEETSVEFCECPIPNPGRDKFCKTCFKVVSEKGMATAAAHMAAMTATPSGVPGNGMRTFGKILSVGGLLFAISPMIAVAVGCAGSSDSSCGAGAIVMMFTVPVGGLAAAIGSVLLAIGSSRRNKALAASRAAMSNVALETNAGDDGTNSTIVAPPPTPTRPTRPVPKMRTGQIFIGAAIFMFALGAFINPHRGQSASGFYAVVSPIDCWWLAVLCAIAGTFIAQAQRHHHSPERFWSRVLIWCGGVIGAWCFLLLLLMGLPGGIGEYVNQAFDAGNQIEGFSPLSLFTGSSGSGLYGALFPSIALGSLLVSRGIKKAKSV